MVAPTRMQFRLLPSHAMVELCEPPLDSGGEGEIYLLRREGRILKRVFHPSPLLVSKLRWMREHMPLRETDWAAEDLGWPEELVVDPASNNELGYVARYFCDAVTLEVVCDRKARVKTFPLWSYAHLVNLAANLARAFSRAHRLGLVIGDASARNALCDARTLVKLIDLESAQIVAGQTFLPCLVATPDYAAPELQAIDDFASYRRSVYQDCFSLGVLTYQLLLDGIHPYCGTVEMPRDSKDLPPDMTERIGKNLWPHSSSQGGKPRVTPPKDGCDFGTLPASLQELFHRAFDEGHQDPSRRPLPLEIAKRLDRELERLSFCPANSKHRYWNGLKRCPWCERQERLGIDSFPN